MDTTTKTDRSGGPKTTSGKRRASLNSTKHGLHSAAWRLPNEDAAELAALTDGIIDALDPQDVVEEELARRITFCFIRQRRIERYECAAAAYEGDMRERAAELNAMLAFTPDHHERRRRKLKDIAPHDARLLASVPDGKTLDKLTRWDSHVARALRKAMDELRAYRELRTASRRGKRRTN